MANVENFRYEIDELNAVRIWDDNVSNNGNHPMIFQPDYPDGKPFEDAAAAEAWVVSYLTDVIKWHKENPPVEEPPVE
jgi:hypothetical protein